MLTRREWIAGVSTAAAGVLARSSTSFASWTRPKRILVLGGTSFLGPAVVDAALAAGHSVTLFNRGVTNPDLFPEIERLRGFRDTTASEENYSALARRTWDAIIDVWPFEPNIAESAARQLRDRSGHYLYVSSIAAYPWASLNTPQLTEDAPLLPWDPEVGGYNRGKAESERRIRALLGDRLTVVRPGPIKGQRDTAADFFTWLYRMKQPGPHVGPGAGDEHFQLVDVHDVARFLVTSIDAARFGAFNLTGRSYAYRDYLAACASAVHAAPEIEWVDQRFLHEQGIDPASDWTGPFPNWHPNRPAGFYQVSSERAFRAGWVQRPFAETAEDCLTFFATRDPGFQSWVEPLPPARERAIISAWRRRGAP